MVKQAAAECIAEGVANVFLPHFDDLILNKHIAPGIYL